jgi:hypothetical protein
MEIAFFLTFVGVCAMLVIWATRKSRDESNVARDRRLNPVRKARAEKLETPVDNLLSHREEIWQSRRKKGKSGVLRTNRFIPRSESSGDPEYDGFSRRDRHHVRSRTAQVKEEGHLADGPAMTSIEFESEEHAIQS